MIEELLVKVLVSAGGGAVSACLLLYFVMDKKISVLETELEQLKTEIKRIEKSHLLDTREMEEVNKKLDRLLEFMPVFRLLEKRLRLDVGEK